MNIKDLKIILRLAELKNITETADSLNMSVATASAAIKRVEKALNTELFIRTTRSLRISRTGEIYIPLCKQALFILEKAEHQIKTDTIQDELRITVSSDLGRNYLLGWLDEFLKLHDKLKLKIHISDNQIDFYRSSLDVALRYEPPTDSGLFGFKIIDIPRILCASPAYLVNHPCHKLENLSALNGLFYQLHDIDYTYWEFFKENQKIKIRMKGDRSSNDGDIVKKWCIEGKGVTVKSCLDMANELLNGQVIHLLPEYQLKSLELWLVFPSKEFITPLIHLLKKFLTEKCRELLNKLKEKSKDRGISPKEP